MFRTFTIAQLKNCAIQPSKEDLFKDLDEVFDYALPQFWLNAFSRFLAQVNHPINYDLIRSTTVWSYGDGSTLGKPVFACREVAKAYQTYIGWLEKTK